MNAKGQKITWISVTDLAACIITLKDRKLGFTIDAKLPGSVVTFPVPDGFLLPRAE